MFEKITAFKRRGSTNFAWGHLDPVKIYFKENLGTLIGLLLICILMAFVSPYFLTVNNILNVLRTASTNLFLSCGMTLVIILGGIDLSVGSVVAMSGVIAGILVSNHVPLFISVLMGVLSGVLVGTFNGFVIAKTTIPPLIVTLATMNIARGIAYVSTNGQPVSVMSGSFDYIGSGAFLGIPLPVYYMLVAFVISIIILNRTKLGRYIYAIGGNIEAARFSGVKIQSVKFFCYAVTGLLAGIAGVVLSSQMFSGQPTAGNGAEMDAIAAVVLGGTSMNGGVGKLGGTLIGVLIIGILNNAMNLLNVNSFYQYIVKGVVILAAVYMDYLKRRRSPA